MLINDVIDRIRNSIKEEYSYEYVKRYSSYDNSGLLLGDSKRELTSCVLCVDVTSEVVAFAIKNQANLIISHHPLIFTPINSITTNTPQGKNIINLIKHDICVYSSHLCLDIANGGINDEICKALKIRNTKPLIEVLDAGLGRIGCIKNMTFGGFFETCKDFFCDTTMWFDGDINDRVNIVSVLAGGGGGDTENVILASKLGAEVYISSDFKHHVIILAREIGLKLISVSHYKMEHIATAIFEKLLSGVVCHVF